MNGMVQDGLWCSFTTYHMGITAKKLFNFYHNYTRGAGYLPHVYKLIAANREISFNHDKLYVNGGRVVLGRPVGASGVHIYMKWCIETKLSSAT